MPLLTRYVLRRWATPLLGALLFYGFLLLSWEMVTISKEIFSEGAPLRWLIPMLALSLPENLGLVLPMAAVLGGMMGTQHLMEGSELVAAQGLGAGRRTWTSPWIRLSLALVALALVNAHLVVPQAARWQQAIRGRMAEEAQARFLRPGAPPWMPPSAPQSAFWVSPEGQIHLMEATAQGVQHLVAESMTYAVEAKPDGSAELQLHLTGLKGALFQPAHGGAALHLHQEKQVLRFPVPAGARLLPPTPLRYDSTGALLQAMASRGPDGRRSEAAWREWRLEAGREFARRMTIPLSASVLLLLGIALGFGHPRFYRGGAILKSLGVIMLYYLVMKYSENMYMGEKIKTIAPLLALPLPFLAWGWWLLSRRLSPHRSSRLSPWWFRLERPAFGVIARLFKGLVRRREALAEWIHGKGTRHGILRHWSSLAWFRNWGSALGSLLVLNLLIEYATLAGDLSKNGVHVLVFIQYWIWNLPPFLVVALPMAFLLGSLLTFSEAALSREWLALRAGGVSLLRWIWSSRAAWGLVTLLTLGLQVVVAPTAMTKANSLYRKILNRSQTQANTKPWLHLGSTGVLWHLQPDQRWGFPLKPAGEAPILLRWKLGEAQSEALAWGGLRLVQGPPADRLFPDRALRNAASAEEARTTELIQWQRWAPDPERSYLLWSRILGCLAGPCLVLAMLSFAFPGPRAGRGSALGMGLVGGLVFMGLQTLFGGAARASEIPPAWGVMAPLLLLLALALLRLQRLRT